MLIEHGYKYNPIVDHYWKEFEYDSWRCSIIVRKSQLYIIYDDECKIISYDNPDLVDIIDDPYKM